MQFFPVLRVNLPRGTNGGKRSSQKGQISAVVVSGNKDSKTDVFLCLMIFVFNISEKVAIWPGDLKISE